MATPQKIRCKVKEIEDHGDHVYTVDLIPERPLPKFKPGQFLHLTLDDYDPSGFWPESRVFSIASSPNCRNILKISYSVRGRYTTRMEKEIQVGRSVWVKLPYGDFVIQDANNIVLLAGGTGITAFIAYIDGLSNELIGNVFLAYGARKRELLLYRDLIDSKIEKVIGFHATYFVEDGQKNEKNGSLPLKKAQCLTGCLTLDPMWVQVAVPQEATYYIAGPPTMIKTLTLNLLKKDIQPKQIKVDAWE